MRPGSWAFVLVLILSTLTVQSFDSWRPFAFASARAAGARSCSALFGNGVLTETERQVILGQTQQHLITLGFQAELTKDKEGHDLIELIGFPTGQYVGKLMAAVHARFQTQFFVDPFLRTSAQLKGYFSPSANSIVLDAFEFKNTSDTPSRTLLHEIRHAFLQAKTKKSIAHSFQGEILADDGRRIGRKGFYDDFLAFDELSTYFKDAKADLTQFRLGRLKKQTVVKDLKYLHQVADMVTANLTPLVYESRPSRFGSVKKASIPEAIYRIKDKNNKFVAGVFFDLPELSADANRGDIYEASQARIQKLLSIAAQYRTFANTELAKLTPND